MTTPRLVHLHQRLLPRLLSTANGAYNPPLLSSSLARRGIVTSSVAPSPDVFIERPEVMVLAESSLYNHSWKEFSEKFYPSMGLHVASIDIMQSNDNVATADTSLKYLEKNMVKDLSHLGDMSDIGDTDLYIQGHAPPTSTSAHAVVIARGPIQCLAAQYFLESSPLAGLVLVDPLLLPADGRAGKRTMESEENGERWKSSLIDLVAMLENEAPHMMHENTTQSSNCEWMDHPMVLPSGTASQHSNRKKRESSLELELSLLHSLANENAHQKSRPLKLEPGTIPVLVLYSGNHSYHDYYRICSERTASFHTCGGRGDYFDQVSVLKIPKRMSEDGPIDDLDKLMSTIYEWYDDVVA